MTEPIRILHMIGSLNIGGSQSMIINLHKAIDKTKVQFDYIIDRPEQLYYADIVKQLGGKIFVMPPFKGTNFFKIQKAWKNFFKEHPEYKILHSHIRSYASVFLPIARKAGLKTIIHSHNTSNGKGLSSVVKRILQFPLRFQADYFFGCSKKAGAWLFGEKIVCGNRFHLLQNAIDTDKYAYSVGKRNRIRNEFNLHNKFVLGNVGRLTTQKNHDFLIDIFDKVHKKKNNTILMIVGDGNLETQLKNKVSSLGLDEAVIFTGGRSDVADILSAMDVFVFPSLHEGLPVTLVEAQAAGLPIVCSDTITMEVVLTDLVEMLSLNQDVIEWANLIIGECSANRRIDVGEKIIAAGYDIKKSSERLLEFYLKLHAN